MPTLEDPGVARLNFQAKARLFGVRARNPARLPVDMVDVNNWQTRNPPDGLRQSRLTRPRLTYDHDPLHWPWPPKCKRPHPSVRPGVEKLE